jgi:UPF0716 protein FxsA
MRRRLLMAFPLLEILVIWAVAWAFGWGVMLLALLVCVIVGFVIMKSAGTDAFTELQLAGRQGLPPGRGSRHALRFAAGLLIAVPGFLSALAGLALLLPTVQRKVRRWVSARVVIPGAAASGTVVPGHVVFGETPPNTRQEPNSTRELDS